MGFFCGYTSMPDAHMDKFNEYSTDVRFGNFD